MWAMIERSIELLVLNSIKAMTILNWVTIAMIYEGATEWLKYDFISNKNWHARLLKKHYMLARAYNALQNFSRSHCKRGNMKRMWSAYLHLLEEVISPFWELFRKVFNKQIKFNELLESPSGEIQLNSNWPHVDLG